MHIKRIPSMLSASEIITERDITGGKMFVWFFTRQLNKTIMYAKTETIGYYVVDIERALEYEVRYSKYYTNDEALAELKKSKEKLELGLISQQEYDRILTTLKEYIDN